MTISSRIENLENIRDELIDWIYESLASGSHISDEVQGSLAIEIEETENFIQQLRHQESLERQNIPETPSPISPTSQPADNLPTPIQPSAEAELLWHLSGQKEDVFLQYLQNFPSPSTQNLLNNPELLERTIQHLHAINPSSAPENVDGIQQSYINSSNIWGTSYDPGNGKMKVRFQNGSEYEYDGVPINIYRAFSSGNASAKTTGQNEYGRWWVSKSPSLGAALNQYIKAGGFTYRRIR